MPEFLDERCTHQRSPVARCEACVSACPRDALLFTGGRIHLDADACDDCGLCVVACPEGALAATISPPLQNPHTAEAFAACMRVAGAGGEGVLPCLHALADQQIVALARAGVQTLETAHADCAACPRLPSLQNRLETRLEAFNAASRQRGLPGIAIRYVESVEWRKHTAGLQATASRRRFFGKLLKHPVGALMPTHGNAATPRDAKAMGKWLRAQGAGPLPAVPVIDFRRCTLCSACVTLCGQQALRIHDFGIAALFSIVSEQCTGCQLCANICLEGAISVEYWREPEIYQARLVKRTCNQCSHGFWEVSEAGEKAVCCPVCTQSGGKRPNRIVEE